LREASAIKIKRPFAVSLAAIAAFPAIEQVEVIRRATAIHGFGATCGPVEIITRRPEDGALTSCLARAYRRRRRGADRRRRPAGAHGAFSDAPCRGRRGLGAGRR
jgi:outer membrane cobalamin receptor